MTWPVDRIKFEERIPDAGVHIDRCDSTEFQDLCDHPGSELYISIDGGDAYQIDLL
jgi:hypothetical protein